MREPLPKEETDSRPGDPEVRERFETPERRGAYYPYAGPPSRYEVSPDRARGRLRVREVRFRSVLPSGLPENDRVVARLQWMPGRTGRQPIVFLHGFGFSRLGSWESVPGAYAFRGHPSLALCLPHLCERAAGGRATGNPYTSTDPAAALPAYEQAVADVRACLDWLLMQPECAPGGAGTETPGPAIMGVSFGALVSVIAAALEPRFQSVVSLLGGGDLDVIVFRGAYRTGVQRQLDDARVSLEARRRARLLYQDYLEEVRRASHPLEVPAPFHFYLFDPLTFASHLRSRPALLMNARFDPVMPRAAAEQLWLELGSPEISWFWGTHIVSGPWRGYVTRRVARFLAARRPGERRIPKDTWAALLAPQLPGVRPDAPGRPPRRTGARNP